MLDWILHTLLWLAYFFLIFLHITLGKYLYEAVKNLRTCVCVCVCLWSGVVRGTDYTQPLHLTKVLTRFCTNVAVMPFTRDAIAQGCWSSRVLH